MAYDDTRESAPKKRVNPYRLALLLLAVGFVILSAVLLVKMADYLSAQNEYAGLQAESQAQEENAAPAPIAEAPMDTEAFVPPPTQPSDREKQALDESQATPGLKPFSSGHVAWLSQKNSDAVAWLDVLDTAIQYPVVQTDNNEYYVTHTFQKKRNDSGAIFLDCWNGPDFSDFNAVIYGHNMKDGSMFHQLRQYEQQRFADSHLDIQVTLSDRKLHYKVFAAYTSEGEEHADFRGFDCQTEGERSAFIRAVRKRTVIRSRLAVDRHDRILTLVTCTSGTHSWFWVVHAVLVEEQTTVDEPPGGPVPGR